MSYTEKAGLSIDSALYDFIVTEALPGTGVDAERYFAAYKNAINQLSGNGLGISIKLSALHPRYSVAQQDRCIPALTEKLKELCRLAVSKNIPLTVDA